MYEIAMATTELAMSSVAMDATAPEIAAAGQKRAAMALLMPGDIRTVRKHHGPFGIILFPK
jgi:hypothetical protein